MKNIVSLVVTPIWSLDTVDQVWFQDFVLKHDPYYRSITYVKAGVHKKAWIIILCYDCMLI